jgi:hypothetical protein
MLRYANVNGNKKLPFPQGRGVCPCCDGVLIAKCGSINTHHSAHESRADCDSWSEPIGAWHLAWQDIVRPEFVEVAMGEHRADVVGNGGLVVELQHSPIKTEDIQAREKFYGNMVWLFDATFRFRKVETGDRVFFSFGQTKHLHACAKPVFLDFGTTIVQVDAFTEVFYKCSGFGRKRDRGWFATEYLSGVRLPEVKMAAGISDDPRPANPWEPKCPYSTTEFPSAWFDPVAGTNITFPTDTPFLPLDYDWDHPRTGRRPAWSDVIDKHAELANGWSRDTLVQMENFLHGTPMIFGGLLRVMPAPKDQLTVTRTVRSTEMLLKLVDEHAAAGRVPVLQDKIKKLLIERAQQFELENYGRLLPSESATGKKTEQPSLFD